MNKKHNGKSASLGLGGAGKVVAVVTRANVAVIVDVLDVQSSANAQVRRVIFRKLFYIKILIAKETHSHY